MANASSFQIQTIIILAMFTLLFFGMYLYNRKQSFVGWAAIAYFFGTAAYSVDTVRAANSPDYLAILSSSLFWLYALSITKTLTIRSNSAFPVKSATLLVIMGYLSFLYYSQGQVLTQRSIIVNCVASGLMALSIPSLFRNRKTRLDNAILVLVCATAVIFIARLLIVYAVFGEVLTQDSYTTSFYAWVQHFSSGIAGFTLAVGILLLAGYDTVIFYQAQTQQDELTGIMNRRGYERHIDREQERNSGNIAGRSVIMFDVDCFKHINDTYGHDVGDAVLRRIAVAAHDAIKPHGKVSRIGGEEFAIILDKSSSGMAALLADHLRLTLGLIVHPELPEGVYVTSSFGIARVREDENFKPALRRADTALYSAKETGRNRVVDAGQFAGPRDTAAPIKEVSAA